MWSAVIEFITFREPNIRFVVLGSIFMGISAALVGSFAYLRKQALVGDTVSHSVLPGICIAFLCIGTKNTPILLLGAFIAGWLSLLAVDWLIHQTKIKPDSANAVALSTFFGLGVFLLTIIQHTGNAAQTGLDKFIFGNAAALLKNDVWLFLGLALCTIVLVSIFFKHFALLSFDRQFAVSIGYPVKALEVLLTSLTVIAIVCGIQAMGVVLVASLLIAPAVAARFWCYNLKKMLVVACSIGALGGYVGAFISYLAPAMPSGPWIVVALFFIALASFIGAPQKGIWARFRLGQNNKRRVQEENILKYIYSAQEDGLIKEYTITPQCLAELRNNKTLEAIEPYKRLCRKNLAIQKGSAYQLTSKGIEYAKRMVKVHRLWELYLAHYLHLPPDHVHEDAESIEHIITPEIEKQLIQLLDNPSTDPHGKDIPY
ncbi:MAG: metal ABC transporter permease [Bacteroidia bacterium]|nr:metal ABC transporter permease [Bacteroidia bacterium]MDW8158984.1 metal ABC transporter permease [Bacteroidia bacterium]